MQVETDRQWDRRFSVPQHIRHDEESHMATADVDLVQVGDTAVACGDGDILELDVHVVFGCSDETVSGGFLVGQEHD